MTISPEPLDGKRIGIVGLGIMGRSYMMRLHAVGANVTVVSRTSAKLADIPRGIRTAASVRDLVRHTDLIILALSDFAAIKQYLLDNLADGGTPLTRKVFIQMATIAPDQSAEIGGAIKALNGSYLEAPIQGSSPDVAAGTATVVCGGAPGTYADSVGLLKVFAQEVIYVGSEASACNMKLCLNFILAAETVSFALAAELLEKGGIHLDDFAKVIRHTAVHAKTFDKKLTRYARADYENPNFTLKNLQKDLALFIAAVLNTSIDDTLPRAIWGYVEHGVKLGLGGLDYSSIREVVRATEA